MQLVQKAYGGGARVGGIAGASSGDIKSCSVGESISINAKGAPDNYGRRAMGGICGDLISGNVTNCYNSAYVINRPSDNASGENVGGIVGMARYAEHTIESCQNMKKVVSNGNKVGGIVGLVAGDANNETITVTITKCKNTGYIEGGASVGGIVGKIGQHGETTIDQSYNTGAIKGIADKERNNFTNIGGIVGEFNPNNYIQYSYNKGSVTGTHSSGSKAVGGLVGYKAKNTNIKGCYNTGSVSVSVINEYYVGGLVGKNEGKEGTMDNIQGTYCQSNAHAYLIGGETADNQYNNTVYQFTTTLDASKLTGNYTYWKSTATTPTLKNNPE